MASSTYTLYRSRLQTYFDQTASKTWEQLTSDAPVSGIRATVRAGRDRMRDTLLGWLPEDLHGRRLLDAGCGTGALAVEAARRGAEVVAIDVAGSLVSIAQARAPAGLKIDWRVGDMLDPALGQFDHVVAMDSLIHYQAFDMVEMVRALAERTTRSLAFTFAPRTPALTLMHTVGKLFPKADRAPAIEPVDERLLRTLLANALPMRVDNSQRVISGFYTSHAFRMVPA